MDLFGHCWRFTTGRTLVVFLIVGLIQDYFSMRIQEYCRRKGDAITPEA